MLGRRGRGFGILLGSFWVFLWVKHGVSLGWGWIGARLGMSNESYTRLLHGSWCQKTTIIVCSSFGH